MSKLLKSVSEGTFTFSGLVESKTNLLFWLDTNTGAGKIFFLKLPFKFNGRENASKADQLTWSKPVWYYYRPLTTLKKMYNFHSA